MIEISYVKETDKKIILTLAGEIDLRASEMFEQKVREILKLAPAELEVDLQNATFMNTPAWAVLLDYQMQAEKFGGSIILKNLTGAVKDSFEIAGIEGLLDVRD